MISARASAYAERMTMNEPPLLRELREATASELCYDDMLSGPVVGAFLNMLVHISKAQTVLEIGTFTGYATLCMAMALPSHGSITTCESNEKYAGIARRFFQRFDELWMPPETGYAAEKCRGERQKGNSWQHEKGQQKGNSGLQEMGRQHQNEGRTGKAGCPKSPAIHLLSGPALQARYPAPVDFIFLDADKENYPEYYKRLLPCLKPGGLMVIDNALWSGSVLQDTEVPAVGQGNNSSIKVPTNRKARAIDHLNRIIRDDPAVANVLLTVRDGLHVLRKCI